MSSSSDEDLSKFSEATDVKLFNNSLFAENKGEQCVNIPVKSSLRYLEAPEENRTDLRVTPGFQKHVASHLMKILDSSLEQNSVSTEQASTPEHDSNGNCTSGLSPKKSEGGIKLFGASAAFIASCNITPPPPTKRRKRGRTAACISSASEDDSSGNEGDVSNPSNKDSSDKPRKLGIHDEADLSERFAACAVSSEWILNGEAVKGWTPCHKSKEPIQGEATPDLIKMTSASTSTSVKQKKKKRKHKKQESSTGEIENTDTQQSKRRGKRGSRRSKKKMLDNEVDNSGDAQDPAENAEPVHPKPAKRRRIRRDLIDRGCEEIVNSSEYREDKYTRKLLKAFKKVIYETLAEHEELEKTSNNGGNLDELPKIEGETSNNAANLDEFPKIGDTSNNASLDEFPKKKRKKKRKSSKQADTDESLNILLKKIKKKKRHEEQEPQDASLVMTVLEDEGFDSDPTKAVKKRKQQRKLLKAKLKRQKKSEKKWQNKIEYLSKDLANLKMANVIKD